MEGISSFVWNHHTIGPVSTNCYIFGKAHDAVMVDPGGPEAVKIAMQLLEKEIVINHVLVTHGHFDHLGWAPEVQKAVEGAKVYLHRDEKPSYEDFINVMPSYGLPRVELREPDVWIKDNELLNISDLSIRVLHTPGHSPGSVTYHLETIQDVVKQTLPSLSAFVGDCIFEGSIGRVDLPYANPDDMISSLKRLVSDLPAITTLFPGHGNFTTVQRELDHNPFLRAINQNIPIF
ncbi:MAG: MBL fold metallo-hydrolase [Candidatus Kariarchaeaceae archaeon]|jgi:glyoxylase-like metal-dependent hydrolase (beta-lactamase superfamily II)